MMNKILLWIADLFLPNRCPICGDFISYDALVCGKCEREMESLKADNALIRERCSSDICSRAVYVYIYKGKAKDGIISLKGESKNFGIYLGKKLSEAMISENLVSSVDCITYVPMSKKKLRKRRYNQAKVIACEISRNTGIPIAEGLLLKTHSAEQHTLGKRERAENAASFYTDGKHDLTGKTVMICDDVITTGSTLGRCAGLIKSLKAKEVYIAAGTITHNINEN